MEILQHMQEYGHEQLVVCSEPSIGLKAFIAIHDTTLGPSCGGLRIWPHSTEQEAVWDVLRLSRAMTYKSAVAGLPLGGGKGLIIADSRKEKTEAMLRAFGQFIDSLGGRYITTEDVGMSPRDLEFIAEETNYVVGLPESMGGSGDTSVMTGLGVYLGIKAAAKATWSSDDLTDRTIAIQGFGNVGFNLATHLIEEGAKLIVTDLHEDALNRAREIGAEVVKSEDIYDAECDIFSPCALGSVLNTNTIPRLKCKVVAGGANNQLENETDGELLHKRGILYAPDYVINAGGIINAGSEIGGVYYPTRARELTERIYETTEDVIKTSRVEGIPTSTAANRLAERRIKAVQTLKKIRPRDF